MQQVRIGISGSRMPVKQLDLCSSVSLLLEPPDAAISTAVNKDVSMIYII
jgi:hypothetical protein